MLHNTSKIIQGATESWFVNYHCSLYIGRPLDASENVFVFMFGLAVFGAIQDSSRKSVTFADYDYKWVLWLPL